MPTVKKDPRFISREALKCIAILLMVLDHAYMTVVSVPGFAWMTMLGRLAFPIFAFQIAEGYRRTTNRKRYTLHMLAGACLSELPYNLMMGGELLGPFHQNVLFTFLLALLLLPLLDRIFASGRSLFVRAVLAALVCLLGIVAGTLAFVDYSGFGVLTVLLFYIAAQMPRPWLTVLVQLVGLWCINGIFLGGRVLLLGGGLEFPEQGLALFSLPLIWCYNGKKKLTGKAAAVFQYGCYLFYPVHILLFSLAALYG